MSSCGDMCFPNLGYHCKGFGAAAQKMKFQWNQGIIGFAWPHKSSCMFKHHVWTQNNSHTPLFSIIITIGSLSVMWKNTVLTMPNAGHSAYFIASTTAIHTSTISRHHSKRVLSFRSPLVVNYSDFPLAISNMPVTLSPFGRQKCCSDDQNPQQCYQPASLLQSHLPPHKESWHKGCT